MAPTCNSITTRERELDDRQASQLCRCHNQPDNTCGISFSNSAVELKIPFLIDDLLVMTCFCKGEISASTSLTIANAGWKLSSSSTSYPAEATSVTDESTDAFTNQSTSSKNTNLQYLPGQSLRTLHVIGRRRGGGSHPRHLLLVGSTSKCWQIQHLDPFHQYYLT